MSSKVKEIEIPTMDLVSLIKAYQDGAMLSDLSAAYKIPRCDLQSIFLELEVQPLTRYEKDGFFRDFVREVGKQRTHLDFQEG